MTNDNIIKFAREVGFVWSLLQVVDKHRMERFAELVAATERRKHQADIEKWKTEAATTEKWRGLALSKDSDRQAIMTTQHNTKTKSCATIHTR